MKLRISTLFVLFLALGTLLVAQGQDYGAPFGAFFTGDADVGVIAIMPTGETMGVLTETDESEQITALLGAVWQTPEGTLTVRLNADGLPGSLTIDGVTLLFNNYHENTVDIAVVPDEGEAVELTGQELDPEAMAILRGFASLRDLEVSALSSPVRAKPLPVQGSWHEIFLRSAAAITHFAGAAVSVASCAGTVVLGATAASFGGVVLWTGAAAAACTSAANTVATLPDSISALWNSVFDPYENLERLQQIDEGYASTAGSIAADLIAMTDESSALTSIGLTVGTAVITAAADDALRVEAAIQSYDALRSRSESGIASDGVSGVFDTTYGAMTFGGGRALYTDDKGRILYDLSGTTLAGYWVEESSAIRCESERDGSRYWGQVVFIFNEDFSAFEGEWGYCDNGLSTAWRGRRHEE